MQWRPAARTPPRSSLRRTSSSSASSSSPTWRRSPSPRRRAIFEDEGLYRHARAAGQLEGAARPRDHRRARRRAHAGGPAARRDDRLRHQGAHHHAVLHGPQRQRHHGLQRGLGADEAAHPEGRRRQARASDQGRGAEAGGRQVQGRRASRSTWAWCSRSRRTTTSCATGSRRAASIPGFYSPDRHLRPDRAPTCCSR